MTTVKQLLREIEELKMREQVWLGIREYLEGFTPEGEAATDAVIDGMRIPIDIVIDVLGDIDSECLGPIQERIQNIESSKVSDGKDKKAGSTKEKSRKRSAKKS